MRCRYVLPIPKHTIALFKADIFNYLLLTSTIQYQMYRDLLWPSIQPSVRNDARVHPCRNHIADSLIVLTSRPSIWLALTLKCCVQQMCQSHRTSWPIHVYLRRISICTPRRYSQVFVMFLRRYTLPSKYKIRCPQTPSKPKALKHVFGLGRCISMLHLAG